MLLYQSLNIGDAGVKPLYIGSSPQHIERAYHGLVDEVRVWNIDRSQSEIQSTMNNQLGPEYYTDQSSGLVGYWQFNEGTGQITADLAKSEDLILNGKFDDEDNYWIFSKADDAQTE
jgi:hypothetical protein